MNSQPQNLTVEFEDLALDLLTGTLECRSTARTIYLPPVQRHLLRVLFEHAGQVMTQPDLYFLAKGREFAGRGVVTTVKIHVWRIRKALTEIGIENSKELIQAIAPYRFKLNMGVMRATIDPISSKRLAAASPTRPSQIPPSNPETCGTS